MSKQKLYRVKGRQSGLYVVDLHDEFNYFYGTPEKDIAGVFTLKTALEIQKLAKDVLLEEVKPHEQARANR